MGARPKPGKASAPTLTFCTKRSYVPTFGGVDPSEWLWATNAGEGMKHVTTAETRKNMSELINRAAYGGERFVVTRHGKELVAIVPLEDATLVDRLRGLIAARDYEGALREMAEEGTVPWAEVRRELDL